jgi:hypothetical protein
LSPHEVAATDSVEAIAIMEWDNIRLHRTDTSSNESSLRWLP